MKIYVEDTTLYVTAGRFTLQVFPPKYWVWRVWKEHHPISGLTIYFTPFFELFVEPKE